MYNLDEVMSRLNKLLTLANRTSNIGEMEAAQAAIQRMITRYQIDSEQLRLLGSSHDTHHVSCEYIYIPNNTVMNSVLLNTIAKHNFCKVLRSNDACLVYGYPEDIKLCLGLYSVLVIHMQSEHDYKLVDAKSNKNDEFNARSWSKSFYVGYCVAVGERLSEAKQSTIDSMASTDTSIVLAVKNKQHEVEEFYQSMTSTAKSDGGITANTASSGYIAGHASGRNSDIGQTRIEQ
jgi:hypothetical protein